MKILDQYLYAIGRKLPYHARNEIIKELKSILLDSIEDTYGPQASDAQIEAVIENYGSPREVANRYKEDHLVIGAGYTDLYFFIGKLILMSLAIAFSFLFVIGIIAGDQAAFSVTGFGFTSFNNIIVDLARLIGRILTASINAMGWLTLVFIILTRINNDQAIDLDEDWTPADLKDIQVGPEGESRLESAITIFFLLGFTVIINTFPGLISLAERSFAYSGLLSHTIHLSLFKVYLIPLSILWLTESVYHVFNLFYGSYSRKLALFKLMIDGASTLVLVIMFFNTNLYMDYQGIIGFRAIFGLIALIGMIELIGGLKNFFKYYVIK